MYVWRKIFVLQVTGDSTIQRLTDWGAAASLLKGVYTTLSKYPYIAHLPHLKMVVQVCQSLILGERTVLLEGHNVGSLSDSPPPHFCSMVVKIIAMQILALGVSYVRDNFFPIDSLSYVPSLFILIQL